jgi:hypothetical protein
MSDGNVLEHRWLMHEMAIPVPEGFHVHHRNGVRHDNRWSNLQVLPAGDHHRHHIREAGYVTNQYGTFPVLYGVEERKERQMRIWRASRERRRR